VPTITISFRGKKMQMEICRSPEATAELMERWKGVLAIERIFAMPSASSHRARVHLANKALVLFGVDARLDGSREADELTAQLKLLSGGKALPKKKER
jgi:hypothetical protein